jgi:hypothetical protein
MRPAALAALALLLDSSHAPIILFIYSYEYEANKQASKYKSLVGVFLWPNAKMEIGIEAQLGPKPPSEA